MTYDPASAGFVLFCVLVLFFYPMFPGTHNNSYN